MFISTKKRSVWREECRLVGTTSESLTDDPCRQLSIRDVTMVDNEASAAGGAVFASDADQVHYSSQAPAISVNAFHICFLRLIRSTTVSSRSCLRWKQMWICIMKLRLEDMEPSMLPMLSDWRSSIQRSSNQVEDSIFSLRTMPVAHLSQSSNSELWIHSETPLAMASQIQVTPL